MDNRLNYLLLGMEEDSLTPDEVKELTILLRSDSAVRRYVVEQGMLTGSIARYFSRCTDVSRADVEREPAQESRRIHWPVIIPLAAAAALLLGLYGVNAWQVAQAEKSVVMSVAEVRGEVAKNQGISQKNAGFETPVRVGDPLRPFDALRTGADGDVTLVYSDGSKIELQKNSKMALAAGIGTSGAGVENRMFDLAQKHGVKTIQLDIGRLIAQIAKQPSGRAMVLTTPHAKVAVVGTTFTLVANTDQTRLDVQEGLVQMESLVDQKMANVGSGEFFVAGKTPELKTQDNTPKPEGDKTEKTRTPAPQTEYKDGKILFEDDFKEGLKNWGKVVENKDGKCVEADIPEKCIRVMDDPSHTPARMLIIGGGAAADNKAGVRLKEPITAEAYSVSYDYEPLQCNCGSDPICVCFEPGTKFDFMFRMKGKQYSDPVKVWNRRRFECVRVKDQAGHDCTDVTWIENGQLRERRLYMGVPAGVQIKQIAGAELRYGRVVIRELVPKDVAKKEGAVFLP